MSSILTNTSAMVALQTLKSINMGLEKTQADISTGKSIANAKDNSAIWAISKVMESDVSGFKAVADSLSLGESTVSVAQTAAETVTDLLGQIKEKVIAAQGDNVDRTKLGADITALKEQIVSVVDSAQFNGLNLVNGGSGTSVISSVIRSGGTVAPDWINVSAQDLSAGGYTAKDVFVAAVATSNVVISANADTFVMSLDSGGGSSDIAFNDHATVATVSAATGYVAGDSINMTLTFGTDKYEASYTITDKDVSLATALTTTIEDIIAVNIKAQFDAQIGTFDDDGDGGTTPEIPLLSIDYDSATPGTLVFTNNANGTDSLDQDMTITGQFKSAGSGGLSTLSTINGTSTTTLSAQLVEIDNLIGTAITAAAAFGSVGTRIATQMSFVSKLTDSMTAGIGSLVDADMEEASARLQALQVQQQLGIQALSIANQAPQNVLALFG